MRNKNIRKYHKIKDEDTLIFFVGYLDTFKGIFELIDAFFEINKYNKNIYLMIVGTGPKLKEFGNRDKRIMFRKIYFINR